MFRYVALLTLMINTTNIYAMENNISSVFSHIHSSISQYFNPVQESERIRTIRSHIENFKNNKSEFDRCLGYGIKMNPHLISYHLPINVKDNLNTFLIYCFNAPINHLKEVENIIFSSLTLLPLCKKASIDGYSCIGAVLTRDDLKRDEPISFLKKLINFGFIPTEKDKQIIQLQLYDTIKTNHKTAINLLLSSNNNYNPLPLDVRKIIMSYIISILHAQDYIGCILI